MALKDFFKNRQLKRAAKLHQKQGSATAGNINELKAKSAIDDDLLCSLWTKCQGCNELLYTSELKKNLSVCKKCNFHHRLTSH